jgi:hypothetical protein
MLLLVLEVLVCILQVLQEMEVIQVLNQSQLLVVVVDDVMPMVKLQVEVQLEVLVQYKEVCTLVHPTPEMPEVLVLLKDLLLVLLLLIMEVAVVELVEMHAEKMVVLV